MDEGVDPKDMCQGLMNKLAQSEQLMAVADPQVLVLFEDWLEELEAEVLALMQSRGLLDEKALADKLGLSRRGATFLLSKLAREGKLPVK